MPTENGEMDVHVASQGSSGMHKDISMALNVPMNKINVKVKRCGKIHYLHFMFQEYDWCTNKLTSRLFWQMVKTIFFENHYETYAIL